MNMGRITADTMDYEHGVNNSRHNGLWTWGE